MTILHRTIALMLLAAPLGAQSTTAAKRAPATVMDDMRQDWKRGTDYLTRAAAAVPESTYAFRPTPAVRTFGQIIAHVAGSQYSFCAVALGEKPRSEDEIEKATTTKSGIVQAFKESNDYCARAYAQSEKAVAAKVADPDDQTTRRAVLMLNTSHNYEHYGNVITYMRMNGMVPPSSQPTP
jgi:uncharacterized damage-inducible protein DinB